MNRTAALVCALALIAPAMSFGQVRSNTNDYCRQISPRSFAVQEVCIKQENEAFRRVNSRRMMINAQIWSYCNDISPVSWSIFEVCISQEEAAQERLRWSR